MYKNFQANYARTLSRMIEESKVYFLKKAAQRTTMKEPDEVPEERKVQGKNPNQTLYKSEGRESAHERHLRTFMEQLRKVDNDYQNREAIERD